MKKQSQKTITTEQVLSFDEFKTRTPNIVEKYYKSRFFSSTNDRYIKINVQAETMSRSVI